MDKDKPFGTIPDKFGRFFSWYRQPGQKKTGPLERPGSSGQKNVRLSAHNPVHQLIIAGMEGERRPEPRIARTVGAGNVSIFEELQPVAVEGKFGSQPHQVGRPHSIETHVALRPFETEPFGTFLPEDTDHRIHLCRCGQRQGRRMLTRSRHDSRNRRRRRNRTDYGPGSRRHIGTDYDTNLGTGYRTGRNHRRHRHPGTIVSRKSSAVCGLCPQSDAADTANQASISFHGFQIKRIKTASPEAGRP